MPDNSAGKPNNPGFDALYVGVAITIRSSCGQGLMQERKERDTILIFHVCLVQDRGSGVQRWLTTERSHRQLCNHFLHIHHVRSPVQGTNAEWIEPNLQAAQSNEGSTQASTCHPCSQAASHAAMCSVFTEHLTNMWQRCLGARETKRARTGKDSERIRYLFESPCKFTISIQSLQWPCEVGILMSSCYRWNWGSEWLSGLPQITKKVNGNPGFEPSMAWFRACALNKLITITQLIIV